MRTSLVVTVLIISILVSHAQGIRLNKGFLSQENNKIQKDVARTKNGADVEAVNLKDEHISGEIRKLMAKALSNPSSLFTSTTSKNGGNKQNASRESTLGLEHQSTTTEQYPDTYDLAGMDYSPAKRKPPIHN